ncbi:MAG: hypothetical protein AAF495_09090 [Pseudomonadota bacterium]
MADDSIRHLPFGSTLSAVTGAIWSMKWLYVALVLLITLPWGLATGFGLFEPLFALQSMDPETDPAVFWAEFPLGLLIITFMGSLFTGWVFAVVWTRTLLLGPRDALRIGLGEGLVMLGRFAVGGLAVGIGAMLLLVLALCLILLVLLPLCSVIGLPDALLSTLGFGIGVLVGYLVPMAFLARTFLIFPAIAVGQRMSLIDSWAAMKGSTFSVVAVTTIFFLAAGALSSGIQLVVFGLLGIDFFDPAQSAAAQSHWVIGYLLGPINWLPAAVFWAVAALAYQTLSPDDQPSDLAESVPG